MNVMSKLVNIMRGSVREVAINMIDLNSLRIFEQEIVDSECHVRQAKQDLAQIIAEKVCLQRENKAVEQAIAGKEKQAVQCLEQQNEQMALTLATSVAEQRHFLEKQRLRCQQLGSHEMRLKDNLQQTVYRLENYRTELRCLRATASAQQARGRLASNTTRYQSRFKDMQDSLQRIRQKQQAFEDRMDALDQVDAELSYFTVYSSESSIDDGQETAHDVLQRLQAKVKD